MRPLAYSRLSSLHSTKQLIRYLIIGGIFLIPCSISCVLAQTLPAWSKIDTVTSGPYDDFHPVIQHSGFGSFSSGSPTYAIFERRTPSESQIAAARFNPELVAWDTTVQVISSVSFPEVQLRPDYAERQTSSGVLRIAVWHRNDGEKTRIWYSTLRDTLSIWSAPSLLVTDSLENSAARVIPFYVYPYDSTFMVTWKCGKAIKALLWSPEGVTDLDTMGLGETDSLEYDMASFWSYLHLVWTSGSMDRPILQYKRIDTYNFPNQVTQETLLTSRPVGNPRIVIAPYGPPILVETRGSQKTDILYSSQFYGPSPFESLTEDSTAENRNASAYDIPVVTKRTSSSAWAPQFDACAYEKYRGSDSMLVFMSDGLSDTVRSPGHNSNPVVGSQPLNTRSPFEIPFVWESNRTGRSHLYSRRVAPYIWSVDEDPVTPASYVLYQNYPNPFNPVTVIHYTLGGVGGQGPGASKVGAWDWGSGPSDRDSRSRQTARPELGAGKTSLVVYDVLGRQVATLVNEAKAPGSYDVRFDGSGLASGVYFYRLTAGSFVQSRKMVLIK